MAGLSAAQVADKLRNFVTESSNPVLFAGAGVSMRAGLPSWAGLLNHAAKAMDQWEQTETAALVRTRVDLGNYQGAAVVYLTCDQVPPGKLYETLVAPLKSPDSPKLRDLMSLPWTAAVTTNYDAALHNAYAQAHSSAAINVESGDGTFKKVPYMEEFYIARIHGRVQIPSSLVLCPEDYRRIQKDSDYADLLWHVFTRCSCAFLGFSFADPAITLVLDLVEKRLGPDYPKAHIAFLPSDAAPALVSRLNQLNVETLRYPGDGDHPSLWEGISLCARNILSDAQSAGVMVHSAYALSQQFLATTYARGKLSDRLQPLRNVVLDGIIIHLLTEGDGLAPEQVSQKLRAELPLSKQEASEIAHHRIAYLSTQGWCIIRNGKIFPTKETKNELQEDIGSLVQGVYTRYSVQQGASMKPPTGQLAYDCIESTLMARGWDLGAYYVGAEDGDLPDASGTIASYLKQHQPYEVMSQLDGLETACRDLFHSPSEDESAILARLGRIAFGLNLAYAQPCATIVHQDVLPERLYLDASFLMPTIVEGHPLRPVYQETLRQLQLAAESTGLPLDFVTTRGFLNEIVAHRRQARHEVAEQYLDDLDYLKRHILRNGAGNTNVFIGAYSSWADRDDGKLSFDEFLTEAAPYQTEEDLVSFLENQAGITVCKSSSKRSGSGQYERIRNLLQDAYREDVTDYHRPKAQVLVDHEAAQIACLMDDLDVGRRSYFVTADHRLCRLVSQVFSTDLSQMIITHRNLVQFVDLVLGLQASATSLARLYWGGGVSDTNTMIHDYLMRLALLERDEALTMAMTDVLRSVTNQAVAQARTTGVVLVGGSPEEKGRTTRFMDRVENDYYANMSEVMKDKYPDQYNLASELYVQKLGKRREQLHLAIDRNGERLRRSRSPEDQSRHRGIIDELEVDLSHVEALLSQS